MDVYAAIDARRTIRAFQDKAVPSDVVKKIIEAGLKAPTNDHMRQWEFVLVNEKKTREKLLRISDPKTVDAINDTLDSWGLSNNVQRDMYLDALPKQYSMLYHAGCLILPFFRQEDSLLQPESLSSLNGFASIWCCIENMLLAAASEGIFGVTRIPMTEESVHIKEVVGHPDNYVLPCYLALGYPADNARRTKQNDLSADNKIHVDCW